MPVEGVAASAARALLRVGWPLLALIALLAFNLVFTPHFFDIELRDGRAYGTLIDILNHGSKLAIVALGMTLVIATGGVDLSVGAVVAISGAVAATLITRADSAFPIAAAAALSISLLAGLLNGALVAIGRVQPIVATLVLMVAGRGVAQLITDGLIVTFDNPALTRLGSGAWLGLPLPVMLLALVAALAGFATRGTSLGLFLAAVGENETAARLSGVSERGVKLAAYAFCGFCAGVAGLVECAYIRAADANNAGLNLELDAILAVVIGGTALAGGRFTLLGTLIGALLIQTLTKTLYMNDISADVAGVPKALAVLAVCLLYSPTVRSWAARRWRRDA